MIANHVFDMRQKLREKAPFKKIRRSFVKALIYEQCSLTECTMCKKKKKKKTVFIVEVHLAIQASLQALNLNAKKQIIQINLTW